VSEANRRTMAAVLEIWNGADAGRLPELLAPGYRGHMLAAVDGDRDGAAYPEAIARYRAAAPDIAFVVVDQFDAGERLVTRLEARRPGSGGGGPSIAHGMNVSRFASDARLEEEWAIWSPFQTTAEEART
jgi:hypothetical protein